MLSDNKRLRRILTNRSLSVEQRGEDAEEFIERKSLANIDIENKYFAYNNIGDEGCKALAAALPQCPPITSINLDGNNIGDEGCKALAAALPQCPSITSIDLRGNNDLTGWKLHI